MLTAALPTPGIVRQIIALASEAGGIALEGLKTRLRAHQRRRKHQLWLGGILAVLATLVVRSAWQPDGSMDEGLEALGLVLILAGGLGRAWSILYIGGRKTRELVREGPYSLTRNPLYLFTFTAVVGLGLQVGSLSMGVAYLLASLLVFLPVIRAEEGALAERFGPAFLAYRQDVPRLVPRLWALRWRDVEAFRVAPAQLYRSLRDSAVLVAVIPLFDAVEWLQGHHALPVLVRLP